MATSRRNAIKNLVLGSAAVGVSPSLISAIPDVHPEKAMLNDNIHQSACYWCYHPIELDPFCAALKQMGLKAVDLLQPDQLPVAKKYGLDCPMCYGGDLGIPNGWNDPKNHAVMLKNYTEAIPVIASFGFTNVICFAGYRRGMDDETGLKNCVKGLKKLMPVAEKNNVVLVMELLNSKVNHPDYMCDHTAWGVELCKRLGSEHFKLLYDIYHMQIMEGDVIRTIRDNHQYIAHYHTGGVPGRHELDETQELYYPAIMRAIVETGYQGYVAQEFVPTPKDDAGKMAALKKCVQICDV